MFLDKVEIKKCACGASRRNNDFGFVYCQICDIFFCPQCDMPLQPSENGAAACTYCNNTSAAESLVCPI